MMMRAQTEILFTRWVTLTEHKWVIFRERRSKAMEKTFQDLQFRAGKRTWKREDLYRGRS
jgi:hypothetical protein